MFRQRRRVDHVASLCGHSLYVRLHAAAAARVHTSALPSSGSRRRLTTVGTRSTGAAVVVYRRLDGGRVECGRVLLRPPPTFSVRRYRRRGCSPGTPSRRLTSVVVLYNGRPDAGMQSYIALDPLPPPPAPLSYKQISRKPSTVDLATHTLWIHVLEQDPF